MAKPNSVKIVEVNKVGPLPASSQNSTTTLNTLPLTFFDLMWLRFPPLQLLFFYEFPKISSTTFFHSIIPKLNHSLSLTLNHFIPLAGNLTWPETSHKPFISYVEGIDGVSFTVAESEADLYNLLLSDTDFSEATACHPLLPHLVLSPERAAVLSLQVTLFRNLGFCIGLSAHHAVTDGKALTTFIKTWSEICKLGGDDDQLIKPLYDRSVMKDPKGLEAIYVEQWLKVDGPNNRSFLSNIELQVPLDSVRGTFELTWSSIEKLRNMVEIEMAKKQNKKPVHISTFSLTCAYAWTCLVKAEDLSTNVVFLSLPVDCRSRLEPCIPNYWGNCVASKVAVAETRDVLGKEGFVVAVNAIGEAIKSLDNIGQLFDGAEKWVSGMSSLPPFRVYSISWSPRFEVYGTDFGWGRPRKVDVTSIDRTGAISVKDCRHGGGVEIELVLKKHHMDAFASLFAQGIDEDLPV